MKALSYSSNYRIWSSCCLSFPHYIHHSLCSSDPLGPARPHSLCSFDLQGSRTSDKVSAGRTPELCAGTIHDHHLCYGRCSLFYSARCRRRCHEQWFCKPSLNGPMDHRCGSRRPACLLWCLHHHLHLLPLADYPIAHPGG